MTYLYLHRCGPGADFDAWLAKKCRYPGCVFEKGHGDDHAMSWMGHKPDAPPPTLADDIYILRLSGYAKICEPELFDYLRETHGEDAVRAAICQCADIAAYRAKMKL